MPSLPSLPSFPVLLVLAAAVAFSLIYVTSNRFRPVRYPVPSIWQKAGERPGEWNNTLCVWLQQPTGFIPEYRIAGFHDGQDFVTSATFTSGQVNKMLDYVVLVGYLELDYEQYKGRYGMQDIAR